MRRGPHRGYPLGTIMILLGVIILLYLILPSGFWWFLVGVALIYTGCCWSKRRW